MRTSKLKNVSSLFSTFKSAKTLLPADDKALAAAASSLNTSSPGVSTDSGGLFQRLKRLRKESSRLKDSKAKVESSNKLKAASISDGVSVDEETSPGLQKSNESGIAALLENPWYSNRSKRGILARRKDIMRTRKEKWVFRSTQNIRIDQLVGLVAEKIGTDTTVGVFGKLGRDTGVKEYNALIKVCLEEARDTEDEKGLLTHILKAYQLLEAMKEQGFQLEDETYGPILLLLMDKKMIEEFQLFSKVIYSENPKSLPRLAYYEMLLWIGLDDEEKIRELCEYSISTDDEETLNFKENYFLALCERNRNELLLLVDAIDITTISSPKHLASIFRSLGRLLLESFMIKFIMTLKGFGEADLSKFICDYAIGLPDVEDEDLVLEFINLHQELVVTPCSASYGMLIRHFCDSLQVHVALDVVDQVFDEGLTLSAETFISLLDACHRSYNYNLVHRVYSIYCRSNLKPNNDIFRNMINLCVKLKDFAGAYNMIKDLEKNKVEPTAALYNAILAGYVREKNMPGAMTVLTDMKKAGVYPDSQTYSYLIGACNNEEDIIKYYEEMKLSGVQVTKQVLEALVHAYAVCGLFEKAKQVIYDTEVTDKNSSEIKVALVSAYAHHGEISDALNLYEEIRGTGYPSDPQVIIDLIDHIESDGELVRMLGLLEEINEPEYWLDACNRVILYCVRYKHLSCIVQLFKQIKDKLCDDEIATEVLFDQVFSAIADVEHPDVQFGMDLLKAIKKELGVFPSRRCLGFLLSACAFRKDLKSSLLVWKEYEAAGFPYNALTLLSMYKVLLACGDQTSAEKMLKKIPKEDSAVSCVIKDYQNLYKSKKKTKKKPTKSKKKKK